MNAQERRALVFVGIASKRGPVHYAVSDAIERLKWDSARERIVVQHRWEERGDVCIARGLLVQAFLDHPQRPDFFLSLDDDVANFTGADLVRLVKADEDFVGGIVPGRSFNPHTLALAVQKGVAAEKLQGYLSPMLVHFHPGQQLQIYKGSLLPCDFGSLGFALISRRAIERMIAELPEAERRAQHDTLVYPRLFRFTENEDGESMDDTSFISRLWQKCGGTVFVDIAMRLAHFGLHPFLSDDPLARLRLLCEPVESSTIALEMTPPPSHPPPSPAEGTPSGSSSC